LIGREPVGEATVTTSRLDEETKHADRHSRRRGERKKIVEEGWVEVGHRCSKCGLVGNDGPVIPNDRDLPRPESIPKSKRWRICENRGGEVGELWDPADHLVQRKRMAFVYRGRRVRCCSPRACKPIAGTDTCSIGPVASDGEIMRAWGLEQARRRGLRGVAPDIRELWWHRMPGGPEPLLGSGAKSFHSISLRISEQYGPSHHQLMRESAERYGLAIREVSQLFRKAYPMLAFTDERRKRQADATLWIAFDLRRGVDDQVEQAARNLRILKGELETVFGAHRMRSATPDIAWRNLRCYLLLERAGLSQKEIAAEVFPNDREAAQKVRKILSEVRRRLRSSTPESSTPRRRER
jgi:hypothetical protein